MQNPCGAGPCRSDARHGEQMLKRAVGAGAFEKRYDRCETRATAPTLSLPGDHQTPQPSAIAALFLPYRRLKRPRGLQIKLRFAVGAD